LAVQQGKTPPERIDAGESGLSVVREAFEQRGLDLIKLEQRKTGTYNFETFLLNFITQDRYIYRLVSYALQVEKDNTVSLITGCFDFLEVGKSILDRKYGGGIDHGCVIALGRKG
jgi:hypothetical protein